MSSAEWSGQSWLLGDGTGDGASLKPAICRRQGNPVPLGWPMGEDGLRTVRGRVTCRAARHGGCQEHLWIVEKWRTDRAPPWQGQAAASQRQCQTVGRFVDILKNKITFYWRAR